MTTRLAARSSLGEVSEKYLKSPGVACSRIRRPWRWTRPMRGARAALEVYLEG